MDFGRLHSTDGIDLSTPPGDPRTAALLGALPQKGPLQVYTGAPLWSERRWVGSFYPQGSPPGRWLGHYAEQLNAIEHNGSFHAIPSPAQTAAWAAQLPPGFRFCPKVPQVLSHGGADWRAAVGPFRAAMEPLSAFLGPILLQFPPEAGPADWPEMAARVEALDGLPLAVELRHPDWFVGRRLRGRAWGYLAEKGHATVVTDTPGRRDVCHASLSSPVLFLRFLAVQQPSDLSRIADLAEHIAGLAAIGLQELYFFAHQPDFAAVPDLLLAVHRLLGARLGVSLPLRWSAAGPTQLRLV